ncbi:MAG: flavodoxin domain-containing protein [Candidatus Bathyarchaeota archaeon]|nr:flavodoxin domain-containing protein [Candidatus Bathyarchaeota archaeon]
MKSALVLYSSHTGNTQKIAQALKEGIEEAGMQVTCKKVDAQTDVNYFDYDLICIGTPSLQWSPSKPLDDLLKRKMTQYRKDGAIKPSAPAVKGKNVLIFVSYSGPHTGLNEATPVGKYVGQFFEHLGFTVLDEWYILSEFVGSEEHSTKGRMGDIRGKPTAEDLQKIKADAKALATKI